MTTSFPRIVTDPETRILGSIAGLASDAGAILDRASQSSLYDRIDWLRLTGQHLWPDAPLAVATARNGADAVWLPLRDCGSGHGRGYASWYTLAFAPILTSGCDSNARERLLGEVARKLRKRFATINLWPLEPNHAIELRRAFAANGWLARDVFETANWIAHTAGLDFEGYWASRRSKLRNTVRRKSKNSAVESQVFDRFDESAWSAYQAIYTSSWKPPEGSSQFLRAFAQAEGDAGTLRLGIARREGRPVAAQLWTVENGVATIHKLAHLESEREHSPGTLLSHAMFRHVLTHDRPATIDYGNGDEPYKADWMDERRERRRLQLFNLHSPIGVSRAVIRACRATVGRLSH